MRKLISMLMPIVLIMMAVSFALARGAPTEQNAFTDQAIVAVESPPIVANVPPMTVGYDVICNLSTPTAMIRAGNAQPYRTDTSDARLSTTGDEHGVTRTMAPDLARSGPMLPLALRA